MSARRSKVDVADLHVRLPVSLMEWLERRADDRGNFISVEVRLILDAARRREQKQSDPS